MFSPQGFLSLVFSLEDVGQHPPNIFYVLCQLPPARLCVFCVGAGHCLCSCGLFECSYCVWFVLPIIFLACCTASTTHKKSCVGACSHAVRVMSYERCMLREVYLRSRDS